jgi:hypothetical protein
LQIFTVTLQRRSPSFSIPLIPWVVHADFWKRSKNQTSRPHIAMNMFNRLRATVNLLRFIWLTSFATEVETVNWASDAPGLGYLSSVWNDDVEFLNGFLQELRIELADWRPRVAHFWHRFPGLDER